MIDKESTRKIIVSSITSEAIGAVAGSGGSAFSKGGKLLNEAASAIGDLFDKSIRPSIKKAGKKIIKKAGKYIAKSYGFSQVEDFAFAAMDKFSSTYIDSCLDNILND